MLHCKHASKRLDKRFVDRHRRLKKKLDMQDVMMLWSGQLQLWRRRVGNLSQQCFAATLTRSQTNTLDPVHHLFQKDTVGSGHIKFNNVCSILKFSQLKFDFM